MKLPDDVRQLVARRYDSRHRDWLSADAGTTQSPDAGGGAAACAKADTGEDAAFGVDLDSTTGVGADAHIGANTGVRLDGVAGMGAGTGSDTGVGKQRDWPWTIPLGIPTEPAALRQVDAVRHWASAWRAWRGAGTLRWTERRWRVLGTQSLPESLTLEGPHEAAAWLGELDRWTRAGQRQRQLTQRWPQLAPRLPSCFTMLADYDEDDYERLQLVLEWLAAHPASGLYPRQIPVAGVDTKWMETRKGMLGALVACLLPATGADDDVGADNCGGDGSGSDFLAMCGLRRPPATARMRILDPALRTLMRGVGDICAPVEELAALDLPVSTVLVVENLQSGLALPDLPGAVAFIGLGYGVDVLGKLAWLRAARGIYWGDIDTHGYAILHRARCHLPQLQSMLMDETTLRRYPRLWGSEGSQHGASQLDLLNAQEQAVYQALKSQAWGQNLRLEQERIPWPDVCAALRDSLAG